MSDSHEREYLVVSAPKSSSQDTFAQLQRKVQSEGDLAHAFKFAVPDLKVGTLDSLMALSDELNKADTYVEGVARKVAQARFDAWEEGDGSAAGAQYNLNVDGRTVDDFLTFFQWKDEKFPSTHSLKALVALISSQVTKLDEELKVKTSDYQQIMGSLSAQERNRVGNLLQRDLRTVVKKEHVIETDYLTTIFVCVRNTETKPWLASYERICDFILPRSSQKIAEDGEYGLWTVTLFKRVKEEFTNLAREKKFMVRDFTFNDADDAAKDRKELEAEKEKQKTSLMRFCNVNFTEAFVAWVHLVAIRVFVESVLRYGLPTNFQAMLIQPKKGKEKRVRKALEDLYGHLGDAALFDVEEETLTEQFFPYVSLNMNLEMRQQSLY